jgi:predicted dehydrogenase
VLGGLGIGGRGTEDLRCLLASPDVRFVAICDSRKIRRDAVKEMADTHYGNKDCAQYRDMHEFLARPDVDAVLIATGDRWHTMASITAAKAGKDVYCEKPCSMTIQESRALADTFRRYSRIYQAGTQRRSIGNFIFAANLVASGKLGKLKTVHANTLPPATVHTWLPAEPEPPKDEVDWDRWLGPCPWRPFNRQYVAGGWRGFFDFHGGGILEWGAHTVDLCQWAAQKDHTTPVEYVPEGSGAICTYADGLKLVMRDQGWQGMGTCSARYEGEEGWIETGDSGRMLIHPESLRTARTEFRRPGTDPSTHIRNFLDCVKSRKPANGNADVAARSHVVCHAAYISWQLGRPTKFDPVKEEFIGDAEANRMRSRAMREPWRI